MGRILGLDYGRRRIGIAISDPLKWTAQPCATLVCKRLTEALDTISSIVQDKQVEEIVVGYPLTLKGEQGHMAKEVEHFTKSLRSRISVPVTLWDERFTSVQANKYLRLLNAKPGKEKGKVDIIAAVMILQNYLEYKINCGKTETEDQL